MLPISCFLVSGQHKHAHDYSETLFVCFCEDLGVCTHLKVTSVEVSINMCMRVCKCAWVFFAYTVKKSLISTLISAVKFKSLIIWTPTALG